MSIRALVIAGTIFGCSGGAAGQSMGQSFELQELKASDQIGTTDFGFGVAIDGEIAVVGAWEQPDEGPNDGAAYVFRRVGEFWVEEQKLTVDGTPPNYRFGHPVAVDGDVILVGMYGDSDTTTEEAAYVFRFDGSVWVFEQELPLPDDSIRYGYSMAVQGEVAVVGSFNTYPGGNSTGEAALIYRFDGAAWILEQTVTIATPAPQFEWFGWSVAVEGNRILIGSSNALAAYVLEFDGSSWNIVQTISPTPTPEGFGSAVALDGNRALVGAMSDSQNGVDAGAAYYYEHVGGVWQFVEKIVPADGAPYGFFGWSVDLDADLMIVGATDMFFTGKGAAYVYRFDVGRSQWVEVEKYYKPGFDLLQGYSTAVSGRNVIFGRPGNSIAFVGNPLYSQFVGDCDDNGVTDVLEIVDGSVPDCNNNFIPDSCDIADSRSADVNDNGIPDECETCPGDVNGDGVVSIADLLILLGNWGACF